MGQNWKNLEGKTKVLEFPVSKNCSPNSLLDLQLTPGHTTGWHENTPRLVTGKLKIVSCREFNYALNHVIGPTMSAIGAEQRKLKVNLPQFSLDFLHFAHVEPLASMLTEETIHLLEDKSILR
jgi:hypothetical protein